MPEIRRKKDTINATVSPWVKKEALKLVDTGEFSSLSDLASVAITKFISEYNAEKQKQSEIEINTPTTNSAEPIKYDAQKEMEEFLNRICPEPRELTPREKELAEKAKLHRRSSDTEKQEIESQDSKTVVLFEKDFPKEYILD